MLLTNKNVGVIINLIEAKKFQALPKEKRKQLVMIMCNAKTERKLLSINNFILTQSELLSELIVEIAQIANNAKSDKTVYATLRAASYLEALKHRDYLELLSIIASTENDEISMLVESIVTSPRILRSENTVELARMISEFENPQIAELATYIAKKRELLEENSVLEYIKHLRQVKTVPEAKKIYNEAMREANRIVQKSNKIFRVLNQAEILTEDNNRYKKTRKLKPQIKYLTTSTNI
jgi:hypothetical protein